MTEIPKCRPLSRRAAQEAKIQAVLAMAEKTMDCIQWKAAHNGHGYIATQINGRRMYIHRFFWEEAHQASIPDGMEIDHLCMHKWCVNPHHLELVTRRENSIRALRKAICINGHAMVGDNVRVQRTGTIKCRACVRHQKRRQRSLLAAAPEVKP